MRHLLIAHITCGSPRNLRMLNGVKTSGKIVKVAFKGLIEIVISGACPQTA